MIDLAQILQHRSVSRVSLGNGQKADLTTGIGCLANLRRAMKNLRQARANEQEEANVGTPRHAYRDHSLPGSRLLRKALAKNDLPEDLRMMVAEYLDRSE